MLQSGLYYLAQSSLELPPPEQMKNDLRDNVLGGVQDVSIALLATLAAIWLVSSLRK